VTTYATSSATLTAMDTTNLTISFTAPASGDVLVRLTADASVPTNIAVMWGLLDHTSHSLVGNAVAYVTTSNLGSSYSVALLITGLSSGTSYQYDWAQGLNVTGTQGLTFGGGTGSTSLTQSMASPFVMEVWSA
jgi:hypothetical protein